MQSGWRFRPSVSQLRRLAQGIALGGSLYVFSALAATPLERTLHQANEQCIVESIRAEPLAPHETCVPGWVFAFLSAVMWGPAAVLRLVFWPSPSKQVVQVLSAFTSGGLGGAVFLIGGPRKGLLGFLALYMLAVIGLAVVGYALALLG